MAEQMEVLERVNKAYALIIMGKKTRDIVAYLQKNYKVGQKQAYNYINRAKELREEDAKEYRNEALADQITLLRNLYDKNYKIQDYKECRAIVETLAKLVGSNAPEQTESKVEIKPPIEWVD